MNYTVLWSEIAEEELADIWLNASDPEVITQASHLIDRQLRRDPDQVGESRPNNRRILLVSPLGVSFQVIEDDRKVEVLHVWSF